MQDLLKYINPETIITSEIGDESMFIQGTTWSGKRIYVETFYDYNPNNEDDCQTVAIMFNGKDENEKILSSAGTVEEVINKICDLIDPVQEAFYYRAKYDKNPIFSKYL